MPHANKPRNKQARDTRRGAVSSSWHECPRCGTAYDDPADAARCCQ